MQRFGLGLCLIVISLAGRADAGDRGTEWAARSLRSSDSAHHQEAVSVLVGAASEAVPHLRLLLTDKDLAVRLRALDVVGQIGSPAAALTPEVLLVAATQGPAASDADGVLRALGQLAAPHLLEALTDTKPRIRRLAALFLGTLPTLPEGALSRLRACGGDAFPFVAIAAAQAVWQHSLDGDFVWDRCVPLLGDERLMVRLQAARAIDASAPDLSAALARTLVTPVLDAIHRPDDCVLGSHLASALGHAGAGSDKVAAALSHLAWGAAIVGSPCSAEDYANLRDAAVRALTDLAGSVPALGTLLPPMLGKKLGADQRLEVLGVLAATEQRTAGARRELQLALRGGSEATRVRVLGALGRGPAWHPDVAKSVSSVGGSPAVLAAACRAIACHPEALAVARRFLKRARCHQSEWVRVEATSAMALQGSGVESELRGIVDAGAGPMWASASAALLKAKTDVEGLSLLTSQIASRSRGDLRRLLYRVRELAPQGQHVQAVAVAVITRADPIATGLAIQVLGLQESLGPAAMSCLEGLARGRAGPVRVSARRLLRD